MATSERAVILASGGLDSFLVWKLRAPDALNVFVDVGQRYRGKERQAVSRLAAAVPTFRLCTVRGQQIGKDDGRQGIIPFRNAVLVLAAARFAPVVLLGVTRDEINSDKSVEFMDAMRSVLDISWRAQYWNDGARVHVVESPVRAHSKAELVAEYIHSGYDPAHLALTVSCYSQDGDRCGNCASCFKRWVAMRLNNIPETYTTDPRRWAEATGVLQKATDGTYTSHRANEIIKAWG